MSEQLQSNQLTDKKEEIIARSPEEMKQRNGTQLQVMVLLGFSEKGLSQEQSSILAAQWYATQFPIFEQLYDKENLRDPKIIAQRMKSMQNLQ